ncbi:REP element-mobilizing transposase RayT [Nonomuraea jabiensis]|uniref:REP element-mobilizing transposase RayT n=1 Tax=Nonomuraea jabiensis TaxID=882448 RepID=A0A7W9G0B2_9ACTN|nr:REP element-mobilizing transposase RayT [Nonomuraea jabiensis]
MEMEVMPDHVHLLVEADPQSEIHKLVKATKGRSSRVLRQEFPSLMLKLPMLWINSCFVATVGGRLWMWSSGTSRTREPVIADADRT